MNTKPKLKAGIVFNPACKLNVNPFPCKYQDRVGFTTLHTASKRLRFDLDSDWLNKHTNQSQK